MTEKDNPQRKTVFTLLDNVKEQMLEAQHKRNVSYRTLAKELTNAGMKVSEPTLRKYMQAQGVGKKKRKKGRAKDRQWPRAQRRHAESRARAATDRAQGEPPRQRKHRFNLEV